MDQQQGQRPERARNRAWLQNDDGAGFTTEEAKLAVMQDIRDALLDLVTSQRNQTSQIMILAEILFPAFHEPSVFQRAWLWVRNKLARR